MGSHTARSTKADVVFDFRRAQILAAARQCFARKGVANTTMETIAKAAGVAKGTVYLYYRSKDDVLHQLLTEDLAELHDSALRSATGAGTLDERLRRFLGVVISFFERRRDFVEHCQLEMSPEVRKKAKHKLGLVFAELTGAWRTVLQDEAERGSLGAMDLEAAARAVVSLAHGMAIQRLRGWQTEPLEAAIDSAASVILHGVRAR